MDYPISVPSVGLVGGKFVDEDPLAGTPGSLIPAQWGNAATDEILNTILGAGLVPDENNNAQLVEAIRHLSTGRLIGVRVFSVPGTSIYVPTSGTTSIVVEVQAGGGGGGAVSATPSGIGAAGAGGGGGGYAMSRLTAGFSGVSIQIGAAGTSGSSSGGPGGTSSFGAFISAAGGNGGTVSAGTSSFPVQSNGGDGGPAVGGNIYSARGGDGLGGVLLGATNCISGAGGQSKFSPGGARRVGTSTTGGSGANGSGGSGAVSQNGAAANGGAGGAGLVIIWEYA